MNQRRSGFVEEVQKTSSGAQIKYGVQPTAGGVAGGPVGACQPFPCGVGPDRNPERKR